MHDYEILIHVFVIDYCIVECIMWYKWICLLYIAEMININEYIYNRLQYCGIYYVIWMNGFVMYCWIRSSFIFIIFAKYNKLIHLYYIIHCTIEQSITCRVVDHVEIKIIIRWNIVEIRLLLKMCDFLRMCVGFD